MSKIFNNKGASHNPNAVLDSAIGDYSSVIVIGMNHKGENEVRATTNISRSDMLWMIECFKAKLMSGYVGE